MNTLKTIVYILLGTIVCCDNPFATRDPESPSEERSTWLQPIFPERVIDNLKYSIQEASITNYMKCLTDSNKLFRFIPDAFVMETNQGFFDYWDLTSEQNYISRMFTASQDSIRIATFTPETSIDYVDSVLINVDYELEVHHNLTESYPDFVEGKAEFWLKQQHSEWFISRWIDYGIGEQPSWSSIKASFGK